MTNCKECNSEISKKAKQCPNCGADTRNWFMRHKVISLIGIIVILGVIGSIGGGGDSNDSSPSEDPNVATDNEAETIEDNPEIVISAVELASQYEANEVKANQDYKDKLAEIEGEVKSIGESMGQTYVILSSEKDFAITDIQCFFKDEAEINKIVDLNKGDRVNLIGKIDGMSLNVSVKNCELK